MPPHPNMPSAQDELAMLRSIIRGAGEIAAKAYETNQAKTWNKADNTPVTEADIAVNDYLFAQLMAQRPDYGWLSEETQDDQSRRTKLRSFVVDPIDGTRSFIDRTRNFTICVAAWSEVGFSPSLPDNGCYMISACCSVYLAYRFYSYSHFMPACLDGSNTNFQKGRSRLVLTYLCTLILVTKVPATSKA